MINPRTIPYTPQRLLAIRNEFTRPLPQATDSIVPLGSSSFDGLKGTSQANLESTRLAVAENGMLVSNSKKAAKLSSVKEYKSLNLPQTQKGISRYVPYIIGGVIITLAIYLYLQSQSAKEKEETHSAE